MTREFLYVWTARCDLLENQELQLTICTSMLNPIPGYRMNTFKARYFIQHHSLPVCDFHGREIGHCLEAFKPDENPSEMNRFVTRVKIEDAEFWKTIAERPKSLRSGLWATCLKNNHAKTGA